MDNPKYEEVYAKGKDMEIIADLLKKHRIPGVREDEVRRTCAAAAQSLLQHPVSARQVRYAEGKLSFSVPSILKSEILLKQADLKALLAAAGVSVVSIA